jgi:hypothetical protein
MYRKVKNYALVFCSLFTGGPGEVAIANESEC